MFSIKMTNAHIHACTATAVMWYETKTTTIYYSANVNIFCKHFFTEKVQLDMLVHVTNTLLEYQT